MSFVDRWDLLIPDNSERKSIAIGHMDFVSKSGQ